ncbi:hypothetical protein GOB46_15835 [Sinorhizobium meliloti]|uniref:hypothetical protein n=1 Tax=Rhizobium meliloti TaxID=382 RepID=UPI00299D1930|nr:hypothetical protein [Sinorhizobium meliloti]MDW9872240.1 hypothetical protein [Sinorhizobium meliloti]MDW9885452.1 hypothetical protein [Sinorhizobium meliloti]MDX0207265.1 hypothetical protein [Sinorhizobium meliloti]
MGFILAIAGVAAGIAAVASPFIAYGLYRDGSTAAALKAGAVFIASVLIILAVPKGKSGPHRYEDCTRYSSFADDC